jgi:peptidyl-prolyl cis-trans isomerase SurA
MYKPMAYLTYLLFLLSITLNNAFAEQLDHVVAIVNEGVITSTELNEQVNILRGQMLAHKVEVPPAVTLRKQVLQRLIDADLTLQLAKRNNMSIDDQELDAALNKIATDNKLSFAQLQEAVQHEGLSWNKYREKMRKEILMMRLQQKAVGHEVQVSAEQVEDYLKTVPKNQERAGATFQLQDLLIPLSEEPTSDQVKKAREKVSLALAKIHKGVSFDRIILEESNSDFTLQENDLGMRHLAELPEIFAKAAINMQVGEVQGPLRTGNGFHLIRLTAIGGDTGKHEVKKTHVRHILLKADTSMTSFEAQRQVNNLYQQLKSGKSFEKLAKQYSLDPVSAAKGGDLGWVVPGELVPEVEKAMDKLAIHQVSKPIKSTFGWHLIEVLERKTVNDTESFKRQQVRNFLQQRKFSEAVANWQQHMRTSAYIKIMDKELA